MVQLYAASDRERVAANSFRNLDGEFAVDLAASFDRVITGALLRVRVTDLALGDARRTAMIEHFDAVTPDLPATQTVRRRPPGERSVP